MTNLTDEAMFEAIKRLRGERFNIAAHPSVTPIMSRPSFTQIAKRLRSQGYYRSDGSSIETDAVIALYRAKVPKD